MSNLPGERKLFWCGSRAGRVGTVALLCGLLVVIGFALLPSPGWAAPQQLNTPAERTVQGTVVNGSGAPQDHVVVYLQDTKTMVIRSYVTTGGGQFHFHQLSPDTDYQVWAELNKQRSKTKTVSMFSSHLKFTYKLKIKS